MQQREKTEKRGLFVLNIGVLRDELVQPANDFWKVGLQRSTRSKQSLLLLSEAIEVGCQESCGCVPSTILATQVGRCPFQHAGIMFSGAQPQHRSCARRGGIHRPPRIDFYLIVRIGQYGKDELQGGGGVRTERKFGFAVLLLLAYVLLRRLHLELFLGDDAKQLEGRETAASLQLGPGHLCNTAHRLRRYVADPAALEVPRAELQPLRDVGRPGEPQPEREDLVRARLQLAPHDARGGGERRQGIPVQRPVLGTAHSRLDPLEYPARALPEPFGAPRLLQQAVQRGELRRVRHARPPQDRADR
mmetsp:Transcript_3218/g.7507  ORF Transcript_3218/g.7507 Transcript_3218/m.7507 type:complete len:304 (-) Transcript_3218:469-1380(-)